MTYRKQRDLMLQTDRHPIIIILGLPKSETKFLIKTFSAKIIHFYSLQNTYTNLIFKKQHLKKAKLLSFNCLLRPSLFYK